MNRDQDLPSFELPPLNEVALGIGFKPLECWNSIAPGEFYNLVRSGFPKIEDKAPLSPLIVGDEPLSFEFEELPAVRRTWFVSEDDSLLIQVQADRLHVNWRRTKDDSEYPRHEKLLDIFKYALVNLVNFASERGETLSVVGGEISYVNHIVEGDLWNSWSDLSKLFETWNPVPFRNETAKAISSLVVYDGAASSFLQPGNVLNVEIKAAMRQLDKKRIVVFQLLNRGKISSSNFEVISSWVQLASAEVVRVFTEITAKEAHLAWKRIR